MTTKPGEEVTQGQEAPPANEAGKSTGSGTVEETPSESQTGVAASEDGGEANFDGKVHHLKPDAFKRLKDKAKQQGRRAAMRELADAAKAAGFESVNDAFAALAQLKSQPEQQATQEGEEMANKNGTRSSKTKSRPQAQRNGQTRSGQTRTSTEPRQRKDDRQAMKMKEDRDRAVRKWRQEERRRRDLQKQLDAKDAEMQLREAAVLAGVRDVDYALRLLTRELSGKTPEELKEFDEQSFFSGLRDSKPYLFGEHVAPATTGNGSEETPPAPDADAVKNKTAGKDSFDARKASAEDYQQRLRELGVSPNA